MNKIVENNKSIFFFFLIDSLSGFPEQLQDKICLLIFYSRMLRRRNPLFFFKWKSILLFYSTEIFLFCFGKVKEL